MSDLVVASEIDAVPERNEQSALCISCGEECKARFGPLLYAYNENGKTMEWEYNLVECGSCGLTFVKPLPSLEIIKSFYPKDYGSYAPGKPKIKIPSLKATISKWRYSNYENRTFSASLKVFFALLCELFSGKVVSFCAGLPLQLTKRSSIMDIGYGNGGMLLSLARNGYQNLYGYDVETNSYWKSELENSGITIFTGDFENIYLGDNSLDCIILNHVLEHISDPNRFLIKCRRLLKLGGFLAIEVPCDRKETGCFVFPELAYQALENPKHLYMYTRNSLRKLLTSVGFSELEIRQFAVVSVFVSSLNNCTAAHLPKVPQLIGNLAGPLYSLVSRLADKGEFITALAIK